MCLTGPESYCTFCGLFASQSMRGRCRGRCLVCRLRSRSHPACEVRACNHRYNAPVIIVLFSTRGCSWQDALERANAVMGSHMARADVHFHHVRLVAPNKPMLCLSFRAPLSEGVDTNQAKEGSVHSCGQTAETPPLAPVARDEGGGDSKRQRLHAATS